MRNWGRKNVKRLVEPVNRFEKRKEERQKKDVSFSILTRKNAGAVSIEREPNTKRVSILFQFEKPLLCLEFNKSNKQNVYEINFFKNSTFFSLKIIVFT